MEKYFIPYNNGHKDVNSNTLPCFEVLYIGFVSIRVVPCHTDHIHTHTALCVLLKHKQCDSVVINNI